jgi:predicted Zn-dependent peptidase
MLDVLTGGPESVLHKLLVDTGKASAVDGSAEPASEQNLSTVNVMLAPKQSHEEIEKLVLQTIAKLTVAEITPLIKKAKAKIITDELFARTQSQRIAQELTEYVSSGQWERYGETTEILKAITVKQVSDCLQSSFIKNNMTVGHFIGTN